jgi:hypothetical protein
MYTSTKISNITIPKRCGADRLAKAHDLRKVRELTCNRKKEKDQSWPNGSVAG